MKRWGAKGAQAAARRGLGVVGEGRRRGERRVRQVVDVPRARRHLRRPVDLLDGVVEPLEAHDAVVVAEDGEQHGCV